MRVTKVAALIMGVACALIDLTDRAGEAALYIQRSGVMVRLNHRSHHRDIGTYTNLDRAIDQANTLRHTPAYRLNTAVQHEVEKLRVRDRHKPLRERLYQH